MLYKVNFDNGYGHMEHVSFTSKAVAIQFANLLVMAEDQSQIEVENSDGKTIYRVERMDRDE